MADTKNTKSGKSGGTITSTDAKNAGPMLAKSSQQGNAKVSRLPKTITIREDVLAQAEAAAAAENRTLSNYLETLVLRDVALAGLLTTEVSQN